MLTLEDDLILDDSQVSCLNEAIAEVFGMMMNVTCVAGEAVPPENVATLTAVVGLAGALSGTFVLRLEERTARRLTELLTGLEINEVDSVVKDALGEVCNMLAGAWKSRTPELSAHCMLSVPTIVSGTSYHVYSHEAPFHLERVFCFEDHCFCVTILGQPADVQSRQRPL